MGRRSKGSSGERAGGADAAAIASVIREGRVLRIVGANGKVGRGCRGKDIRNARGHFFMRTIARVLIMMVIGIDVLVLVVLARTKVGRVCQRRHSTRDGALRGSQVVWTGRISMVVTVSTQ